MEDKSLSVDNYLNPVRWEQMEKLAQSLVQSKAFPKSIQNAAQALVVMQAGVEMGLKPMEAINGLSIINGVVSPWGKTTVKLLRNHGWKIEYKATTERGGGMTATVTKDDESYTDTLYYDNAVKSKWTHSYKDGKQILKVGWYEGANREMKLRYGVLSKIIKTYIPEVLGSLGDIAEVAEDYVIVEEETTSKSKSSVVVEQTPEQQKSTLKDFLEKNKNNPKAAPKPSKIDENEQKPAEKHEKMSEKDKKEIEEAIEGEIVEEGKK